METPEATLVPARPMRGSRTDGDATRARIVEAAGQLFGQQGFAETTSKAIAARAGVDLASINYHFGTRDGLYAAVLAEAHRRLVSLAELETIVRADAPAETRLRQIIELIVSRAVGKRGWNAHVLARELLSPSSHLDVLFTEEMPPKFRMVAGLLSEITGIPVGDPSLVRCLISVGAPCAVLFVVGRIPTPLTNQLMQLPEKLLVDHLHTFAMGGLEAIARERAA
ncbi:TetR/AcrR family transcriptional regulator [Novosphingobium malaysiense]|uniref:Transcriptional regulator n=1 Tax=Novosphingobium malaysiense TaxID=1348853 RepID=A0A0B1ZQK8_9SPHN|nr:TetR/AcrR family transcriptional regulator [Novosphingobium malaysiense]KHK91539.1 transcriptional regulator [Novosphingobium malaysiense]